MNIKDYLHLYLGCEVMTDRKMKYILSGIYPPDACFVNTLSGSTLNPIDISSIKPILRPLSDMTEEEKQQLICTDIDEYSPLKIKLNVGDYYPASKRFRYLLSKHFDLFGLIQAGLAIDKTKITQPQTA